MTNCAVCGIVADLKCGGCRIVFYCGKEHQKQHWQKQHRTECKSYKVKTNAEIGRHVVATRDIKVGEIIMRECPLVIGPKMISAPICLGCHRLLELINGLQWNFYKCTKCSWPLCGSSCEKSSYHRDECDLMAKKKYKCNINFVDNNRMESAYCVIVPIRCILLKIKNSQSFQTLMNLEDHLEERMKTPLYNVLKSNLVTFVRDVMELTEFNEKTILKIAAKLDTNTFEIRPPNEKTKLRALFLEASMFSHDCTPNTRHIFDENSNIIFVATVDIPKGSIISTTYTQPFKSTIERRKHLWQTKYFQCKCSRCLDPSEFGTFCGSIFCSACQNDQITSINPLDNLSDWKCNTCNHTVTGKSMVTGNETMHKEIVKIPRNSPKPFEEFLVKYSNILHATNTHVIQIKYALTQLYGNVPEYYLNDINDAGLERKISLCSELLVIAEKLAPGRSDLRGFLLLDLHEALAIQTKRAFNASQITAADVQEKLNESKELLEEAIEILKVDPVMGKKLDQRLKEFLEKIYDK